MKIFTCCASFLFIIFFLTQNISNASENENIFKKLTVLQCDSLIKANENNPDFVIMDVRTPSSWSPDHLEGSINRNYYDSDFTEQLDALPKHKTYLIHCQSGGRSSGTFTKMQNLGFEEVYDMQGGMSSWKSASLPTTSVIEPKLMMVSREETTENSTTDTIKITVTNRANDILSFSPLELFDIHDIYSDFDESVSLGGAEDYSFFVYHTPGYSGSDSTCIIINSNGGQLDIDVVLKDGYIQDIAEQQLADITVYPNPANRFIQFNVPGRNTIDEISIFDITGKIVLLKNQLATTQKLDVSSFSPGMHFLRIRIGDTYTTQKIMINR